MTTSLQSYLAKTETSRESLTDAGISSDRLDALIAGADPTIDEIRSLAKALSINPRQLISKNAIDKFPNLKLRQNFNAADSVNIAETINITERASSIAVLVPPRTTLRYAVDQSGATRNLTEAERLAHFCRTTVLKADEKSPLFDLDRRILSHTSIYLLIDRFRSIEGAAFTVNERQVVFLAERPDARMRYTLAHEICHYLVDLGEEGIGWFDEDVIHAAGDDRTAERFANAFAAALLMPAQSVADALSVFRRRNAIKGDSLSDMEMVFLARLFGVNFQVAARRCEDLQLLERGAGQSLYQAVVKQYKSPERLGDAMRLPPRKKYDWSSWYKFLVHRAQPALLRSDVSIGRLSEIMGMPVAVVSRELNFDANLH